jgi:hypothetical protein
MAAAPALALLFALAVWTSELRIASNVPPAPAANPRTPDAIHPGTELEQALYPAELPEPCDMMRS